MRHTLPHRLFAVPELPWGEGTVWGLALTLITLVLLTDILTPASLVVGTLLSGAVALAALGASRRTIPILTGLAVTANLVAWGVNAWRDTETITDLINRLISIVTVVLVGLLTYRAREASERAAQLATEERRRQREHALRTLAEDMGGPMGQAEFVERAAAALRRLTQASSVEIGAVEKAMLRAPYALQLAPDLTEQDHSPRLNQRLPLDILTHPEGAVIGHPYFLARWRRPAEGDLLVMIQGAATPPGLTAEAIHALQPLLERTVLLDDLRSSQDQQARHAQLLRDLVYAFSHDLRTPLMANAMNMQAALKGAYGPLPEEYRATLHNGLAANEALLALADQLLLLAKYESGETDDVLHPVNLRSLTLSVVNELKPAASAHGVTFEPILDAVRVLGRPHDLRRAIQNLVDNAIKFSPLDGTVRITLSYQADEAILTVEDQGRGISAQAQGALFQRFHGSGAGRGLGLGLYLTRRIAEAHGGTVRYERTHQARSEFTLTLPLAPQEGRHA